MEIKGKLKSIVYENDKWQVTYELEDIDEAYNLKENKRVIITEDTTEKYNIDEPNPKKKLCPKCEGIGQSFSAKVQTLDICPICKGTGEVNKAYVMGD